MAHVHVGIGGWNFAPWRGTFYPDKLPQAQELSYASRHLTSIEINATFYGSQKPASFMKWRQDTPDDFVFSVKGPRYATHRRDLSEASELIDRFLDSGVLELQGEARPDAVAVSAHPPVRRGQHAALSRASACLAWRCRPSACHRGDSGIGLATARAFIAKGASVAITGRDQRTLDEAAVSLGANVLALRADITDPGAIEAVIRSRRSASVSGYRGFQCRHLGAHRSAEPRQSSSSALCRPTSPACS